MNKTPKINNNNNKNAYINNIDIKKSAHIQTSNIIHMRINNKNNFNRKNISKSISNSINNSIFNSFKYSINNSINNSIKINTNKTETNQIIAKKSKTLNFNKKIYTIKETGSHFYIENVKKNIIMAIEKSFNKIYQIKDCSEMLNSNQIKSYQVDSILGIIDINGNNKYLLVASSSKLVGNVLGADIYNIIDVDLIKITLFNESDNEKNRIIGVKKLFQSKNYYYSNEIDLSSNNLFMKNKKNTISDYCINYCFLKYYFDNFIPKDFYSKIIYGFIGLKKNIEIISNNNNLIYMDILIIERVNRHLNFNTDIPSQMKQIKFICIYKNKNYTNNNSTNNSENNNKTIDTNNNKKYNINIFSFIIYVSNEIANSKVNFNPWNNFILNELSQYSNIVCIINNNTNKNLNDNINIDNNKISKIVFNNNTFGSNIKLLNFTSDWKKNLFFDSYNNSNMYIKSGSINKNIVQEYIFWFIDINNVFYENDCCFNAIIRIMWKAIQQQMYFMNFGIDIGQFNKNNTGNICGKFKEIILNYHNDLDMNKKKLYKSQIRKQLQKVFDYYFNKKNIYNSNKKSITVYDNIKCNSDTKVVNFNKNHLDIINNCDENNSNIHQNVYSNQNNGQVQNKKFPNSHKNVSIFYSLHDVNKNINNHNQNNVNNNNIYHSINVNNNNRSNDNNINIYNTINVNNNLNHNINNNIYSIKSKLSILCITWNVAGIPNDNKYNIKDLFSQNLFDENNQSPDIIMIGMEEIVELDIYNILTITSNEDSVKFWTNIITSTLNEIYPNTYKKSTVLNLIGIYCICFTKKQLKDKIDVVNTNIIKTGLFGTLGNKGYITFTLNYNSNCLISFAIGHLEAGQNSNQDRIDTLKQILETKIHNQNKFKDSNYWIILGDLNFRIDTSFEDAFKMIKNKEFKELIRYDQFYAYCKREKDLAIVNEGTINFAPTYKFVSGSNYYLNESDNIRIPSYTDRILFCNKRGITNINYKSIPTIMYSDHRPVQACFEIEVIDNNNGEIKSMNPYTNYSNLNNNYNTIPNNGNNNHNDFNNNIKRNLMKNYHSINNNNNSNFINNKNIISNKINQNINNINSYNINNQINNKNFNVNNVNYNNNNNNYQKFVNNNYNQIQQNYKSISNKPIKKNIIKYNSTIIKQENYNRDNNKKNHLSKSTMYKNNNLKFNHLNQNNKSKIIQKEILKLSEPKIIKDDNNLNNNIINKNEKNKKSDVFFEKEKNITKNNNDDFDNIEKLMKLFQ